MAEVEKKIRAIPRSSWIVERARGAASQYPFICLGEEAEDILVSTNISEDQRKQYVAVLSKFDGFFRVRKNVIIERAKFNRRSQLLDEPAEQFIASLYNLAADCNFGDLKDQLIRDRIVVGIRNQTLS